MAKDCPICNNKRHVFKEGKGWVRCECMAQLRADTIMSQSGFPDALWSVESIQFKPGDNSDRKMLAHGIISTVKNENKQSMFIYSNSPDKDVAAAIICRYSAISQEAIKSVSYVTIDQLVQIQFGKEYENQAKVNPLFSDITVLSIGREMTNNAHRSALYTIVYDRILAQKFTILCSFIPRNRMLQVYHKAVDDLLNAHFAFYSC